MNAYRQRGYTLLEIIVSVGVFALVMLAVTGAYFALISFDRNGRGETDAMSTLSFALESMTREIRNGTQYACNGNALVPNCPTVPGTSFSYADDRTPARIVTYSTQNGALVATVDGQPQPLTDARVKIDTLSFYVRGVGKGGGNETGQPQVTIILKGTVTPDGGQPVTFSLESAATQRLLEASGPGPTHA